VASPKFDAFMQRVQRGNPENILTLQEWMGYNLTHDVSKQKFLFLEGNGGNGKSVFCAVLIALLGRQNVSHTPLERFGNEFSLVNTLGKLANIATECGELDKAAEGFLKSFTDGSPMQFRQLYQAAFDTRPTARLILCANNRPRFSDRSGALWRRMIVVPFNETIQDHERVDGMDNPDWWIKSGELPGIFWWAVLGLHRLRQNGKFTISDESKKAVEEYRTETNPARSFLLDCCESDGDASKSVECSSLYSAYCGFCKSRGYHPLGEATFGKEVIRTFPSAFRKRIGPRGQRKYSYLGMCLCETNDIEKNELFF
jgi:P4 family phage/plasmid primase-like protien